MSKSPCSLKDAEQDPADSVSLVVYESREGEEGDVWAKDYGCLSIPRGWEFLPSGDALPRRAGETLCRMKPAGRP